MLAPTFLFVPGLRDHVTDHWQTILEGQLANAARVPRLGKDNLSADNWVEALDASIAAIRGPVVLIAHSVGVLTVVHWALRYQRPIRGALLAVPPDLERPLPEGYPTMASLARNGWIPTPYAPLRFESIIAGSTNDPLGPLDRVAQLAACWGSTLVNAGAVGHLDSASGHGEWPLAIELLGQLGVEVALRQDQDARRNEWIR